MMSMIKYNMRILHASKIRAPLKSPQSCFRPHILVWLPVPTLTVLLPFVYFLRASL